MNSNLTTFDFNNNKIRVININDNPYFVANEVTSILGYSNGRDAISKHVDKEDITTILLPSQNATSTDIRNKQHTLVNESGLYALILSSKLSTTKLFKKWVTSEVLPSIRKTGSYLSPETVKKSLLNPDFIIQIATELKEEQNKRKQIEQKLEEAKPKLKYLEQILQSKSLVNINQIAKDYGYSARGFNQMLANLKIQYKTNGQWVLFADYHNKGYTHSSTIDITHTDGTKTVAMHTMWTQKGRMFLYNKLKHNGIIPLIEVENYVQLTS